MTDLLNKEETRFCVQMPKMICLDMAMETRLKQGFRKINHG